METFFVSIQFKKDVNNIFFKNKIIKKFDPKNSETCTTGSEKMSSGFFCSSRKPLSKRVFVIPILQKKRFERVSAKTHLEHLA